MVYVIHDCQCGSCPGTVTPKHPSGEMVFGGSLCRCKCHPKNRASPHILYKQAQGDTEEYKRLLIEEGWLIKRKELSMEDEKELINKMESDLNETLYHIDNGFIRETSEYLVKLGYIRTNHALVPLKHKDLKEFLDKVELETDKRESFTLRNAISGQTSLLADIICSNGKFGSPAPKSVEEIKNAVSNTVGLGGYALKTLMIDREIHDVAQAVHRLVYGEKT